jgi:glycosyltransferase involved in cell wall biosynthesis
VRIERKVIRLLHITTVPMSLGFLRGQSQYMRARGIEMQAVSSPGRGLHEFGDREGVSVHSLAMPRRITPLRDVFALARLVALGMRLKPHIVHAHTPKGGLLGMLGSWLFRSPVRIYHMRGLPFTTAQGIRRLLLYVTEWVSCHLAHQVICVSHSLREEAIAEGICASAKIKVLLGGSGNGVDARGRFDPDRLDPSGAAALRTRFGIPSVSTVVLFVGRVVRDKGLLELASAWNQIRGRYSDAHLIIVGPAEVSDSLDETTLSSLRCDARVHLVGMEEDVIPFYQAADLVVLPSYREGLPNVLLEAAAMRLPVVATRIPGCIDAVAEGESGLLVPVKDAEALAAAMSTYLSDRGLRTRHGVAGRERALRLFEPQAIWAALYEEYRRLLCERSVQSPRLDGELHELGRSC